MSSVCLLAPCFNEEEGISRYIAELDSVLSDIDLVFFDDGSTDDTVDMIRATQVSRLTLNFLQSGENCGHGRTVRKALEFALMKGYQTIVLVDGDGQIPAQEILRALDLFYAGNYEILEGVRVGRRDPWFRKVISQILRILVLALSKKLPLDANTPFRIYDKIALSKILPFIPVDSPTPNLIASVLTRRMNIGTIELKVITRDRLGSNPVGSTWGGHSSLFPPKRLILFCFVAIRRLIKYF